MPKKKKIVAFVDRYRLNTHEITKYYFDIKYRTRTHR